MDRKLNHKVKLIKDTKLYPDEYYTEVMDSMYLPLEASYNGLRTIDVDKLKFRYSWMDIQAAAKAKVGKRKDFIRTEQVKVYPDTTSLDKRLSLIPIMSQCTMIIFGIKLMEIIQ